MRVVHPDDGERWRGILKAFAANTVTVEVPYGKAVTPDMLERALAANPDTKVVFSTLSETSTGVGHDLEAFGKVVAQTDALLAVDGTQYRSMPGSRYGFTSTTLVPSFFASCKYLVATG